MVQARATVAAGRRGWLAAVVVATGLGVAWAAPAMAAVSGTNRATLTVAPAPVRSVTVSPAGAAFGRWTGPDGVGNGPTPAELQFPRGLCFLGTATTTTSIVGGVTVTNGRAAGHIDINGQKATPADAGSGWTLVPGSAGTDQFSEAAFGTEQLTVGSEDVALTTALKCDTAFTVVTGVGSCAAAPTQVSVERFEVFGPTTASDRNGPYTITTTWTAVP